MISKYGVYSVFYQYHILAAVITKFPPEGSIEFISSSSFTSFHIKGAVKMSSGTGDAGPPSELINKHRKTYFYLENVPL